MKVYDMENHLRGNPSERALGANAEDDPPSSGFGATGED
jgi:hypothetical protein